MISPLFDKKWGCDPSTWARGRSLIRTHAPPDVLVQRLRGEIGEGDEILFGVLDDRLGMWDLPGVPQHGGSREGWLGGTR